MVRWFEGILGHHLVAKRPFLGSEPLSQLFDLTESDNCPIIAINCESPMVGSAHMSSWRSQDCCE